MTLSRRHLLELTALSALPARAADRPPNIILMLGDDHRYDALGCRGNTVVIRVNGILQNEAAGTSVDSGAIGLQAEGKVVEFRRIYIQPLTPTAK